MALTLDASTPSAWSGAADPWVSGSFTPPVGSLIVLVCETGNISAASNMTPVSTGLTFFKEIDAGAANSGDVEIFSCLVGASGGSARTISVTTSNGGANEDDGLCKAYIFSPGTFDPADPVGATNTGTSTTQNINGTLTTTQDGSWVLGGAVDWNTNGAPTSTDVAETFGGADMSEIVARKSAVTPTAGTSVNVNFNSPLASPSWRWALVEVKAAPAGGGAQAAAATPGQTWRRHFKHRQFLPAQTAVAGPQNLVQPFNATLGFTGSDQMLTGKGIAASLSFTSSQARRVSKGLSATLSFTGSLGTAAVHLFTQALNATLGFTSLQTRSVRTNLAGTLSFTSSQTRRVAKSISATVSFTGSQSRGVRTNLAGTVGFTGSVAKRTAKSLGTATVGFTGSLGTAAVHLFVQALNATLGFTSSQSRAIRTNLAGVLSFTGSQTRRTTKNLAGTVSFTGSQTRRVATNLAGTVSFTSSQTRRTAKSLGTATVSFTGSVATAAVHFFTQALNATVGFTGSLTTSAVHHFTQALNATLSFTGSLTTRRTIVKALSASLSFTSSQTRRTAKTLTAGLSFTGSQTKRIAKTISATLGLTGLLDRLSSAQPRSGTASIAQMSVPDSTPGSTTVPSASAADGAVPAALRGSGTAPTSEAGTATGPTSSAP